MSEYHKTDNGERCGNCGTFNPPGQDKCINCGQPLTASAGMAERTHLAERDDEALMGGRYEVTQMGGGETAFNAPDDPDRRDIDMPTIPPRPA